MAFTRLEPTGVNTAATFTFANAVAGNLTANDSLIVSDIDKVKINGGTAGYVIQTDGTGNLTWTAQTGGGGSSNSISSGTSNVNIATTNGNVTIGVGGTGNILTVSALGANITGYVTSSGNITAPYFIGNGALLTGISSGSSYSNADVAAYLPTYTGAITASSVTATTFVGNATRAGTVTTAAQPNITSVGTLSSLSVTGLVTSGNIKTSSIQDTTGTTTIQTKYNNNVGDVGITGNLVVGTGGTGNVTATYFIGDGSQLTGINGGGGSASFAKNYYWQGPIQVNTGTQRLYVPANSTVTKASFNLVTAGTTDTVIVTKKNGTTIDTTTMSNSVSNTTSILSASLTLTDYLTVDITTAGASAIGLYVTYLLVPN